MRSAGILIPLSALPAPWGIGTMGAAAREFLEFLAASEQSIWQMLPLGPTGFGDSPYQAFSLFAGNPYLIDLDDLVRDGLIDRADIAAIDWGDDPSRVDYGALWRHRLGVLERAVARLWTTRADEVRAFCTREASWLDDYACFMAIREAEGGGTWMEWPRALRRREQAALEEARGRLAGRIAVWQGIQFLFFEQWERLHDRARALGIKLFGDTPIYPACDSADVWAAPEMFQLDDDLHPIEVAGCPPDGFSATGQLWGNPLFAWDAMERDGFTWWIRRIAHQLRIFDMLRIDHFRGFESYFAIPAGDPDARRGVWRPGPGMKLFDAVHAALGPCDLVAEDLGFLTPEVHAMLDASGFPGMKVLEFAFDRRDGGGRAYQPHNYPHHCIAYVGTHDNSTALGWLEVADPADVAEARAYLNLTPGEGEGWGMMRGIWSSPADTAIVQMQDVLGLGDEARMNTPSTLGGNWCWRMLPGQATEELARRLADAMRRYERCREDG